MRVMVLQFGLDETLSLLRDSAQKFADREIAPLAEIADKQNSAPREIWTKLGAAGFLGITAEEQFGGGGLGYLAHCLVMEEISRACAAIGLSYGAHSNLCVNQISRNGTSQQKEKYLPRLISGEHVGALAMSETGAGSDVMSMNMRAEKQGDSYVLNGGKMWITNGPDADVVVVYARAAADSRRLSAFIVERAFAGFTRGEPLDKLGMRGSNTCALFFDDCRVPAENLLGEDGGGAKVLMSGLDYERVVLAAGPVGIMSACLTLCLQYAQERKQFGEPISNFQLIRAKLADIYTALSVSRAHVYAVATACDRNETTRKDAAAAILSAAENATKCALDTIQILGANGYINDYPASRLLRDAKLYEIGAGTSEIRRLLIGRELTEKGI